MDNYGELTNEQWVGLHCLLGLKALSFCSYLALLALGFWVCEWEGGGRVLKNSIAWEVLETPSPLPPFF